MNTSRNPKFNGAVVQQMAPQALEAYDRHKRPSWASGFSNTLDPWSWATARPEDVWFGRADTQRTVWPPENAKPW